MSFNNDEDTNLIGFDDIPNEEDKIVQKIKQLTIGQQYAEIADRKRKEFLKNLVDKTLPILKEHANKGKNDCEIKLEITPDECIFLSDENRHSKNYYDYEAEMKKNGIACNFISSGDDCDCSINFNRKDNCFCIMDYSW